jgi:hypothetical protein
MTQVEANARWIFQHHFHGNIEELLGHPSPIPMEEAWFACGSADTACHSSDVRKSKEEGAEKANESRTYWFINSWLGEHGESSVWFRMLFVEWRRKNGRRDTFRGHGLVW